VQLIELELLRVPLIREARVDFHESKRPDEVADGQGDASAQERAILRGAPIVELHALSHLIVGDNVV